MTNPGAGWWILGGVVVVAVGIGVGLAWGVGRQVKSGAMKLERVDETGLLNGVRYQITPVQDGTFEARLQGTPVEPFTEKTGFANRDAAWAWIVATAATMDGAFKPSTEG